MLAAHLLDCAHFTAGECRSCSLIDLRYGDQVEGKDAAARDLLGVAAGDPRWERPALSAPAAFRNKAKMVVAGTVEQPTLGILDPEGRGVDLRDCGLHEPAVVAALPVLAELVERAALTPYDVAADSPPARRGELKHLIVTASPHGELMVRVVARSRSCEARLRKHLPWLRERLPGLRVLTLNVQPRHSAVLEGDVEIVLTEDDALAMPLAPGGPTLHLRPRSFFQTNTRVATELYTTAVAWTRDLAPRQVVDLYCGVGGFALHLAAEGRDVVGVEVSEDAVVSARRSAAEAGLGDAVRFVAGDATAPEHAALLEGADLVVLNPPRRGLGVELVAALEASGAAALLYSSCNPQTLARDLAGLPSYRMVRGRLLDMFPQTPHAEVLVLLERVSAPAR